MKVVIDEDLSRSLGELLRARGYEVLDVRDWGLRGRPDEEVFLFAQKRGAVLFTADLGFANTLKFSLGAHCGIVVLRFPNELPTAVINDAVASFIAKMREDDFVGNLVIISPGRLRLRRHSYKPPAGSWNYEGMR